MLLFLISISYAKEALVNVITLKKEKIPIYYETNAVLKADRYVNLKPLVSGRITKIYVNEGDKVKKGQILAKIEKDEYNFQYNQQLHQVKKLEEIYKYNLSVYKKNKFLYEKQLISEDQFLLAKRNLETSLEDLKSAQEQLKKLEKNLKETDLRAPFNGILDKKFVNEGDIVNQSTNIFYIVDPKSLKVVFYLPQRFVKIIRLRDKVKVNIPSIDSFEGKISYISFSFNNENMIKVKADIKQNPLLKEGLYGKVKIKEKDIEGFLIPEKAVHFEENGAYVLIIQNGKAKKVDIEIVGKKGSKLIATGDLKSGDKVILEAPFGIQERVKVKIEETKWES